MAAPTSGPYGTTALIFNPATTAISPTWTTDFTQVGHSPWTIVSSKMAPGTGGSPSSAQAYISGATYGIAAQGSEFWMEIAAIGAAASDVDITGMIASPNTAGQLDFYQLYFVSASPDTWNLVRVFNSTPTDLTTTLTPASPTGDIAAGDYVAMSFKDDGSGNVVIKGWYWALAGSSWTQKFTVTDSSVSKITPAGFFGLESTGGSAWRVGSIFGGAIPAAVNPIPTVNMAPLSYERR